jgi:hypothetical protein
MPTKVLAEDWSDYDKKKITGRADSKDFACTEQWEMDFLVSKIRKAYPQYSEQKIKDAIASCCKTLSAPHPRRQFVECVMSKLSG